MKAIRVALTLVFGLIASAASAGAPPVATAIKATYLVKFANYVAWPPDAMGGPTAPLILCIVGRDPFGSAIDRAALGDHIDQHAVVVRRMPTVDHASGCHIAYLAGDVAAPSLTAIDGDSVLSVTDLDETRARGIVQFALRGGHIGFNIDDVAARRARLTINSRLLAIALSVRSREARP